MPKEQILLIMSKNGQKKAECDVTGWTQEEFDQIVKIQVEILHRTCEIERRTACTTG